MNPPIARLPVRLEPGGRDQRLRDQIKSTPPFSAVHSISLSTLLSSPLVSSRLSLSSQMIALHVQRATISTEHVFSLHSFFLLPPFKPCKASVISDYTVVRAHLNLTAGHQRQGTEFREWDERGADMESFATERWSGFHFGGRDGFYRFKCYICPTCTDARIHQEQIRLINAFDSPKHGGLV